MIKANAKINLYLEVFDTREDGYHDIETIMIGIDLYDELYFNFDNSGDINISISGKYSFENNKNNLVYKAAQFMKKEYGISDGVNIDLVKNIPIGAGLGGGSSDAASCIKFLCDKYHIDMKSLDYTKIAFLLGADVPFFLYNSTCFVYGLGERVLKIEKDFKYWIVLVYPNFEVSTRDAYKNLTNKNKKCSIFKILENFNIFDNMFNRLEEVATKFNPEIIYIKKLLLDFGCDKSLMSGSGASVFGICNSLEKAISIKNKISKISNYSVWALTTV